MSQLSHISAQLAELFLAGQNAACPCVSLHVWMLTRVEQIVTDAHRDYL